MLRKVVLTDGAMNQVLRVPRHVARKLKAWVALVEKAGVETVREVRGYHDEPLHGRRWGQRSIRLNRAYRAIYRVVRDGPELALRVEEVSKHGY